MEQISSFNCKLELLEKTHDIEENERKRVAKNVQLKKDKANAIRAKNAIVSSNSHTEMMFRREEAERLDKIAKMKEMATDLGLPSIVAVLENNEGITIYIFFVFSAHQQLLFLINVHSTNDIGLLIILFFFFLTGTLTKMRRNVHSTNDIARSNHERLMSTEQSMKTIIDMLKEIKEDMRQYNFHLKMETADVGKFFPLSCDEDLQDFMDRKHPEWPKRMKGFYHLLFTTVTKNKRRFGGALLHALFTRDFISCHRWPFPG